MKLYLRVQLARQQGYQIGNVSGRRVKYRRSKPKFKKGSCAHRGKFSDSSAAPGFSLSPILEQSLSDADDESTTINTAREGMPSVSGDYESEQGMCTSQGESLLSTGGTSLSTAITTNYEAAKHKDFLGVVGQSGRTPGNSTRESQNITEENTDLVYTEDDGGAELTKPSHSCDVGEDASCPTDSVPQREVDERSLIDTGSDPGATGQMLKRVASTRRAMLLLKSCSTDSMNLPSRKHGSCSSRHGLYSTSRRDGISTGTSSDEDTNDQHEERLLTARATSGELAAAEDLGQRRQMSFAVTTHHSPSEQQGLAGTQQCSDDHGSEGMFTRRSGAAWSSRQTRTRKTTDTRSADLRVSTRFTGIHKNSIDWKPSKRRAEKARRASSTARTRTAVDHSKHPKYRFNGPSARPGGENVDGHYREHLKRSVHGDRSQGQPRREQESNSHAAKVTHPARSENLQSYTPYDTANRSPSRQTTGSVDRMSTAGRRLRAVGGRVYSEPLSGAEKRNTQSSHDTLDQRRTQASDGPRDGRVSVLDSAYRSERAPCDGSSSPKSPLVSLASRDKNGKSNEIHHGSALWKPLSMSGKGSCSGGGDHEQSATGGMN